MVQSVPQEMSQDNLTVLTLAEKNPFINVDLLQRSLGWERERIQYVLVNLVDVGCLDSGWDLLG